MPRPIPLPPPVTIATCPSNLSSSESGRATPCEVIMAAPPIESLTCPVSISRSVDPGQDAPPRLLAICLPILAVLRLACDVIAPFAMHQQDDHEDEIKICQRVV